MSTELDLRDRLPMLADVTEPREYGVALSEGVEREWRECQLDDALQELGWE